jgi:transposase
MRQKNASQDVKDIAWKAQNRLHRRYLKLTAKGKIKQKAVTAVARELLGFIWAIAVETEQGYSTSEKNRAA